MDARISARVTQQDSTPATESPIRAKAWLASCYVSLAARSVRSYVRNRACSNPTIGRSSVSEGKKSKTGKVENT